MKNYRLLTLLFLLFSALSFAQPGKDSQDKKDQIRALKVSYITTELDLTASESAKFWPVYNAFEDKQMEIRKQKIKAFKGRKDDNSLDKISEKEANSLLAQMQNTDEEMYQLRKKFITNMKDILPAVKILKLKKAEDEFSRKLLQQYRDKKVSK